MEQLVWAIIIIVFIIYTALKNRARNRPDTNVNRKVDTEQKTGKENDRLGRYMEELLGIERPETKPQIRRKREAQKPFKERVKPKEESGAKKRIGHFDSPLLKEHREKRKPPLPEKREICHPKFPWGSLSKKDLPSAIILSEIIGPPISKRKSHRLF
ncbi:MAG: hypothetical protein H8D23_30830 [Candidatus Brocadiales bacterium]|nr:hypothetical protein [Candidatus Brocadiales bacterium]